MKQLCEVTKQMRLFFNRKQSCKISYETEGLAKECPKLLDTISSLIQVNAYLKLLCGRKLHITLRTLLT